MVRRPAAALESGQVAENDNAFYLSQNRLRAGGNTQTHRPSPFEGGALESLKTWF